MANSAIDVMWDDNPVDVTTEANFIWRCDYSHDNHKALFKKSGFQFYNTGDYTLQELCNYWMCSFCYGM
ncbi:MAG: hypothetical protein NC079_04015 [Clostridium sp.]|nr:hypothetical protein [Acetatifactor muris]MCM1526783.1 hypothetical protein [Bacteroides sp.]MCM1562757.1 hypothetical protein [Clostridium sp.]